MTTRHVTTMWKLREGDRDELLPTALNENLAILRFQEIVEDLHTVASRATLEARVRHYYPNCSDGTVHSYTRELWNFLSTMQINDVIVTPYRRLAVVAIGRVGDAYQYRPDLAGEGHHTRPVQWLREDVEIPHESPLWWSLRRGTLARIANPEAQTQVNGLLQGT